MSMLLILTLAGILSGCHGFTGGAPTTACETMFPAGHGVAAQNSPAPYNVSVSATSYTNGQKFSITLRAENPDTDYFEGFFIQARQSGSTEPVGTFSLPANDAEVQTVKCGNMDNSAVTHTGSARKTSKSVMWTSSKGEDVNFHVTAVREKEMFWTNIISIKLSGDNSGDDSNSASGATVNALMLSAVTAFAVFFRSL